MSAFGQEILLAPPFTNTEAVTRDVNDYTSREQAIIYFLENKDKPDSSLLADDFESWSYKGNEWQSKSNWLEIEKKQNHFNIHNLSVRNIDDLAIVCFLLETGNTGNKKHSAKFIVDIWRKSTNKLSARYISDVVDNTNKETTIVH